MNRNHFGRQTESFETQLELPFLDASEAPLPSKPFDGIFIRAPIVEKLLPQVAGEQSGEADRPDTVIAPSAASSGGHTSPAPAPVEVMATLPGRGRTLERQVDELGMAGEVGDIVAVRQGNIFGTSFHPELTDDSRIHEWWLSLVRDEYRKTYCDE